MADEATDTTEAETSTTETTETDQPTTDKAADDTGVDKATDDKAESGDKTDKSLINGGKGPDDEEEDERQDEAAQLPEKYELTPPEGMEIDETILAEVDPVFRDLKLDNDQANKVIALAGPFAERLFKQQSEAFEAQAADWAKDAKKDSEIGGKNWGETETLVAKALDKLGAPKDFRDLLDSSKLGSHPEMIRMFRRMGAAISEDGEMPRSDAGAAVKQDRASVLYPDDVPKKETA